jgi:FKBP-type peptidyl-prolyl cis-trans isomerase
LGQHQVIEGWDEAIAMLSKGGKAKVIIPSKLGYSAQGAGQMIPPFSPLVFEVELVNFKTAPAQPEMPQQPGH